MGYLLSNLDHDGLLEFVKEEYKGTHWDESTIASDEDFIAVWGWNDNGTYNVAVAIYQMQEDYNIDETEFDEIEDDEDEAETSSWYVKVINEIEGPSIYPPESFMRTRPPLTLEAVKSLKDIEESKKWLEDMEKKSRDPLNVGVILSAVACENEQTFIWTTKGNFYIPSAAYDMNQARQGLITVKSLRGADIPMIPTIEERPH